MRRSTLITLAIGLSFLLTPLPAQHRAPGPVRICPLGDSTLESFVGQASPRYYLDQALTGAGYSFDFVGFQQGVAGGPPRFSNWDQDHEAHSGFTCELILVDLGDWVQTSRPDIVLMHLGTNDQLRSSSLLSTITELETCIDVLRGEMPYVTVLVSQIMPMTRRDNSALNRGIATMVSRKDRPEARVVLVDHFSPFIIEQHMLNDGLHPNDPGEQLMASIWYDALRGLLAPDGQQPRTFGNGCAGTAPIAPSLEPVRGQAAVPGETYAIVVEDVPPRSLPFGLLGSQVDWFGTLPLPVDLSAFGASFCTLSVAPEFVAPLTEAGGRAVWTINIPNDPAWIGRPFYVQAACADPSLNDLGLALSDAAQIIVVDA